MTVSVTLYVGGQPLVAELDGAALRAIAEAVAPSPAETPAPPELMSATEVAAHLRTSRQRVYDLASAGRLERVKDGGRVLFRREDVDAYLADGGNGRTRR